MTHLRRSIPGGPSKPSSKLGMRRMPCLHDGHMEGSARRQAPTELTLLTTTSSTG